MKTLIGLITLAMAASAVAVEKSELERKGHKIFAKFESLQAKSDKKVPPDLLRKAKGIGRQGGRAQHPPGFQR